MLANYQNITFANFRWHYFAANIDVALLLKIFIPCLLPSMMFLILEHTPFAQKPTKICQNIWFLVFEPSKLAKNSSVHILEPSSALDSQRGLRLFPAKWRHISSIYLKATVLKNYRKQTWLGKSMKTAILFVTCLELNAHFNSIAIHNIS